HTSFQLLFPLILHILYQLVRPFLLINSKKSVEEFKYHEYVKMWRKFTWEEFANGYLEKVKERIKNGDKTAKWVVYNVYKAILVFLHPIIPFVTEYIYQKLYGEKSTILEEKFENLLKAFS
ncbi:MAG: class I tRNA ligase family protein, partial [Nanopusillaceae archaeon]